jgi:DNA repair exonuclease SbcCD ATPase subunit
MTQITTQEVQPQVFNSKYFSKFVTEIKDSDKKTHSVISTIEEKFNENIEKLAKEKKEIEVKLNKIQTSTTTLENEIPICEIKTKISRNKLEKINLETQLQELLTQQDIDKTETSKQIKSFKEELKLYSESIKKENSSRTNQLINILKDNSEFATVKENFQKRKSETKRKATKKKKKTEEIDDDTKATLDKEQSDLLNFKQIVETDFENDDEGKSDDEDHFKNL